MQDLAEATRAHGAVASVENGGRRALRDHAEGGAAGDVDASQVGRGKHLQVGNGDSFLAGENRLEVEKALVEGEEGSSTEKVLQEEFGSMDLQQEIDHMKKEHGEDKQRTRSRSKKNNKKKDSFTY